MPSLCTKMYTKLLTQKILCQSTVRRSKKQTNIVIVYWKIYLVFQNEWVPTPLYISSHVPLKASLLAVHAEQPGQGMNAMDTR